MKKNRSISIVLIGAPGSGKTELAEAIKHLHPSFGIGDSPQSMVPGGIAIGQLADYRAESHLATSRIFQEQIMRNNGLNMIYTHSLIDSLAYTSLRNENMQDGIVDENTKNAWFVWLGMLMIMGMDSLRADLLFFLEGHDYRDGYSILVEEALHDVIAFFQMGDQINLLANDRSQRGEESAAIIKEYLGKENG